MPYGDGTGPDGRGPRGRRMGPCGQNLPQNMQNYEQYMPPQTNRRYDGFFGRFLSQDRGYGRGRAQGRGRGMRRGRGKGRNRW